MRIRFLNLRKFKWFPGNNGIVIRVHLWTKSANQFANGYIVDVLRHEHH